MKYENSLHCRHLLRPSQFQTLHKSAVYNTIIILLCVCPPLDGAHNAELINSGLSRLPRVACVQEVYMICVTAAVYI